MPQLPDGRLQGRAAQVSLVMSESAKLAVLVVGDLVVGRIEDERENVPERGCDSKDACARTTGCSPSWIQYYCANSVARGRLSGRLDECGGNDLFDRRNKDCPGNGIPHLYAGDRPKQSGDSGSYLCIRTGRAFDRAQPSVGRWGLRTLPPVYAAGHGHHGGRESGTQSGGG